MPDIRADRSLRAVVASAGDDATARLKARAMLMSGYEVVFIGGHQSPDQIAWTAVAEDVGSIVVDAPSATLQAVSDSLRTLTPATIDVTSCAQDSTDSASQFVGQPGTHVRRENGTE